MNRSDSSFSQVLINAVIVHVGTGPDLSGLATNQGLGELFGLTICLGERFVDTDEIERLIKANVDKTVTVVEG